MENVGTKVVRKYYPDYTKCPGCNWRVSCLYCFEGQNIEEIGLCAQCFLDMVVDEGWNILTDEELNST